MSRAVLVTIRLKVGEGVEVQEIKDAVALMDVFADIEIDTIDIQDEKGDPL